MAATKKSVPISDYNNLVMEYQRALDVIANPAGEIARLKAHIELMEEEAKKLHASYVWVCERLEALEKRGPIHARPEEQSSLRVKATNDTSKN